jgi:HK97 family phage portal protein
MSLLEKILGRYGYTKQEKKQVPEFLRVSSELEKSQIPAGEVWENQSRLYQKLSWVNIAITEVADRASSVPLRVKQRVEERLVDIDNHPFEKLIEKPNPLFSRFELLSYSLSHYLLTGNAYWQIIRAPDGEPLEIWPIPSYRISPVPGKRMGIDYYLYKPDGIQELKISPEEITQFKKFHPMSMYVGLSPIECLATTAIGDMKMQEWNTNYFGKNNAKPPGILGVSDMVNNNDWDKMKTDMKERWGGTKRDGLMMIRGYGDDVKWIQMGMSQKDMEFLAGRQFNKEEIFAIYAPGLTAVLDKNATEANAKAGKATLKDRIYTILEMMGQKITNNILDYWGDDLIAKFDEVRDIDRLMKLREDREFARTHTINEIRIEKYNDEPLTDERGDLFPDQIVETFADRDVDQESNAARTGATERQVNAKYAGELKAWEKYEIKRIGKPNSRKFECKKVPKSLEGAIRGALKHADTEEKIKSIFRTKPLWRNYP